MKKSNKFLSLLIIITILMIGCKPTYEEKCDGVHHTESDWIISSPATCTTSGTKYKTCLKCGKEIVTAIINPLGHTEEVDNAVDADCTHSGLTIGSHCSVCNIIINHQDTIPALGHNFVLTSQHEATSTSEGYLEYTCSRCNEVKRVELTLEDPCVENHSSSEWITTQEPTCTTEGTKHKVCVICGIELEIETIPVLSHNIVIDEAIESDCTHTGLTQGSHCSMCSKIVQEQVITPALGHDYLLTNTLAPTTEVEGYYEYTCSRCNDTYKEAIPVLSEYNSELSTVIMLDDLSSFVTNDNGGVKINGSSIRITLPGDYDIYGTLEEGSIIIALLDEEKACINLFGVNVASTTANPIYIESGDKVEISSKNETKSYIYDNRTITTEEAVGAAIYSNIDLEIKGKGELTITSKYNNGIGSKKDLTIKNLTLSVTAPNNALKGNDSLTIESGVITAISSSGDALKTENTDISSKGNQRGIITIIDGIINLYSACDAIDASYDVIINGGTTNIFTESYSTYSGDVTVTKSQEIYLKFSSRGGFSYNTYKYSALFTNSEGKETWSNGIKDSKSRSIYYIFDKPNDAKYVKYFAYSNTQSQQNEEYTYSTDMLTLPSSFDAYSISSYNISKKTFSGSWTNYTTQQGFPGGMGGMQDGNKDAATYSCKGIKADNAIIINDGNITIKSHDDAIHANCDVMLDSGSNGLGNVTINSGKIIIYSDDDGIRADNILTINDGCIEINKSYEGLEGHIINIYGGTIQLISSDDGLNAATGVSSNALNIKGGIIYLNAGGDGLDSNGAINMTGGIVLALGPSNGGNGVLDYDSSFTFSGGLLLAIGCSGMNQKPTASSGNTVKTSNISTNTSSYLTVSSNNEVIAVLKVTKTNQNYCVFAYNNTTYPNASFTSSTTNSKVLVNGLYFVK